MMRRLFLEPWFVKVLKLLKGTWNTSWDGYNGRIDVKWLRIRWGWCTALLRLLLFGCVWIIFRNLQFLNESLPDPFIRTWYWRNGRKTLPVRIHLCPRMEGGSWIKTKLPTCNGGRFRELAPFFALLNDAFLRSRCLKDPLFVETEMVRVVGIWSRSCLWNKIWAGLMPIPWMGVLPCWSNAQATRSLSKELLIVLSRMIRLMILHDCSIVRIHFPGQCFMLNWKFNVRSFSWIGNCAEVSVIQDSK